MPTDVRQVPLVNSSGLGGAVTTPSSGSAFVAITPTPGFYRVELYWIVTGTAETITNNVKLKTKNANLWTGMPSTPSIFYHVTVDRVEADGTNPISLCVTGTPTTGAIYCGTIVLSQIG